MKVVLHVVAIFEFCEFSDLRGWRAPFTTRDLYNSLLISWMSDVGHGQGQKINKRSMPKVGRLRSKC